MNAEQPPLPRIAGYLREFERVTGGVPRTGHGPEDYAEDRPAVVVKLRLEPCCPGEATVPPRPPYWTAPPELNLRAHPEPPEAA